MTAFGQTSSFRARAGRSGIDEFAGLDVRAIRGGHIPGAVNIPYEENWAEPDTAGKLARREVANNRGMSLKSDVDLRSLYSQLDPGCNGEHPLCVRAWRPYRRNWTLGFGCASALQIQAASPSS